MEKFELLIDGEMVPSDSEMDVVNPATAEVFARCSRASQAQLDAAVSAAQSAFPAWARTSIEDRRAALLRVADVIVENCEPLARLLTQEQGKPIEDARDEVAGMAGFFQYFATLDLEPELREDSAERKVELHRKPLGVVGAIIPWNFPLLIPAFKVAPALLAGNTVVLKPAPTTPLATLHFARLVAGLLPSGVLNVIADANDLGDAMTRHTGIRKISFTGSTATGRKVMSGAAETLKRVTLELSGNDAGIVLDDVDPEKVAPQLFAAAFQNTGQICIALKRLYVHESIYDEICDRLAQLADEAIIGDGLAQGTQYGQLQNKSQFDRVKELLDVARVSGTVIAGGNAVDGPGYFVCPTIVRDIEERNRLVDKEQFGPVLPVLKFSDDKEAVSRANTTDYGLGGSVWSSNLGRAYALAKEMDSGNVWINKHMDALPHIPFAGSKQSGLGIEFGLEGLHEFTQLHVINMPPSQAV